MKRGAPLVLVAVLALGPLAAAGCKSSQSVGSQVDDAGIKGQVKAKLAKDVRLSTLTNIEVNSTNGVVTLAGMVPNHLDKMKAEEVARTVDGVVKVNNELQVENPERN
jgi:osmotically-inducible protein OsmY